MHRPENKSVVRIRNCTFIRVQFRQMTCTTHSINIFVHKVFSLFFVSVEIYLFWIRRVIQAVGQSDYVRLQFWNIMFFLWYRRCNCTPALVAGIRSSVVWCCNVSKNNILKIRHIMTIMFL